MTHLETIYESTQQIPLIHTTVDPQKIFGKFHDKITLIIILQFSQPLAESIKTEYFPSSCTFQLLLSNMPYNCSTYLSESGFFVIIC
mgnify:CR=1 FL=1